MGKFADNQHRSAAAFADAAPSALPATARTMDSVVGSGRSANEPSTPAILEDRSRSGAARDSDAGWAQSPDASSAAPFPLWYTSVIRQEDTRNPTTFDDIVIAVKKGDAAALSKLMDSDCKHVEPSSGVSSLMIALSYDGDATVQLEFAKRLLSHPKNPCPITAVTTGHVGHLAKSSWGQPYVFRSGWDALMVASERSHLDTGMWLAQKFAACMDFVAVRPCTLEPLQRAHRLWQSPLVARLHGRTLLATELESVLVTKRKSRTGKTCANQPRAFRWGCPFPSSVVSLFFSFSFRPAR